MREKKKSYQTVFEKMTFKVEKRAKLANFGKKNGRQIAKIGFIQNLKKTSRDIMPRDVLYRFEKNPRKDVRDTEVNRHTDRHTDTQPKNHDNRLRELKLPVT